MKVYSFLLIATASLLLPACHGSRSSTKSTTSSGREYYSRKFGIDISRDANIKLYEVVDSWLGVKYKYAQCSRSGVDCSGLVSAIYSEAFGCRTARNTKDLYEQVKKIKADDLREGDLLFFKMKGNKIDHVGLYLGERKFVHASTKLGVIISTLDESYYKAGFKKAGRPGCS